MHDPVLAVVERRISQLWTYHEWYRKQSPSMRAAFAKLNTEYRAELRLMIRVARRERMYQRSVAVDRGVDSFIEERQIDWGPVEWVNPEGDPSRNGAFNRW